MVSIKAADLSLIEMTVSNAAHMFTRAADTCANAAAPREQSLPPWPGLQKQCAVQKGSVTRHCPTS